MSDQLMPLTHARTTRRPLGRAAICAAIFVVAGAVDGVLWRHLWSPVTGVVQQHHWFPSPFDAGAQHDFNGDAWYFVVALVSGIVLAVVTLVVMRGHELLTLVVVALGAIAAGLLMWRVGMLGNAPDPVQLAKHAADGTKLPSRLYLANAVPLTAFPLGALGTLMSVYLTTARADGEPVEEAAVEAVPGG